MLMRIVVKKKRAPTCTFTLCHGPMFSSNSLRDKQAGVLRKGRVPCHNISDSGHGGSIEPVAVIHDLRSVCNVH